eukprot:SAG11_NODE_1348_length_5137_cov_3.785232_5_plen_122_part_00
MALRRSYSIVYSIVHNIVAACQILSAARLLEKSALIVRFAHCSIRSLFDCAASLRVSQGINSLELGMEAIAEIQKRFYEEFPPCVRQGTLPYLTSIRSQGVCNFVCLKVGFCMYFGRVGAL